MQCMRTEITPDKAYRKCATTVGNVLGRYHPHGDASVYDAMVRMAQIFQCVTQLLTDTEISAQSMATAPQHYRYYTEARMSKLFSQYADRY